jgi:hypothetical protein
MRSVRRPALCQVAAVIFAALKMRIVARACIVGGLGWVAEAARAAAMSTGDMQPLCGLNACRYPADFSGADQIASARHLLILRDLGR